MGTGEAGIEAPQAGGAEKESALPQGPTARRLTSGLPLGAAAASPPLWRRPAALPLLPPPRAASAPRVAMM